MITLYGRKPVQEVLMDETVSIFRLHLANSNRSNDIIADIERRAVSRGIEIVTHTREALSRISKNGRQDQGVAVDIKAPSYRDIREIDARTRELIALDRITNPQNLGMIIRSVAASPMDGLLVPKTGCARIDPLVHKASAGTLIRSSLFHCATLDDGLAYLAGRGFEVLGLDGAAGTGIDELPRQSDRPRVFVLGNETSGLSDETRARCHRLVSIPLANQVESINVAAAAAVLAFRNVAAGR